MNLSTYPLQYSSPHQLPQSWHAQTFSYTVNFLKPRRKKIIFSFTQNLPVDLVSHFKIYYSFSVSWFPKNKSWVYQNLKDNAENPVIYLARIASNLLKRIQRLKRAITLWGKGTVGQMWERGVISTITPWGKGTVGQNWDGHDFH